MGLILEWHDDMTTLCRCQSPSNRSGIGRDWVRSPVTRGPRPASTPEAEAARARSIAGIAHGFRELRTVFFLMAYAGFGSVVYILLERPRARRPADGPSTLSRRQCEKNVR